MRTSHHSLNSMASRINGFTVHAWGEIPWCKSSSSGTMTVQAGNSGSRDMSSMASKIEVCRWVFIDEVEALGAETLGILEENTTEASRKKGYKFRGNNSADPLNLRPFGGLNVCFFGDLWQLPPVMQVSVSSNPFRLKANESHQARKMMNFFWGQNSLQGFTRTPFEFSVCKRVKDKWYSSVIDECRDGALSDHSYNFMHGYPTLTCGSAMSREEPSCGCDSVIDEALQELRDEWFNQRCASKID